jgi:hypothetical protein
VAITHYPPVNALGAERLRAATLAWADLLAELHAVGLRPYLELEHGQSDDPLRIYCELDDELLLELAINDAGIPDAPPETIDGDWTVFIQGQGGYLAEVLIEPPVSFQTLARRLRDLVESVAAGEHPFLEAW